MSDKISGPDSFGGEDFPSDKIAPLVPNGKTVHFPSIDVSKYLTPPVHVAVLCPPGAAVTALLNKMGKKGGEFVMMQSIPMQVGALSKANGQGNVQIFPLLIFSIGQKDFESWMKCKYEEVAMYNMDDIMNDSISNPLGR